MNIRIDIGHPAHVHLGKFTTEFFTWFIENYPESRKIMKENPDYQYRFK